MTWTLLQLCAITLVPCHPVIGNYHDRTMLVGVKSDYNSGKVVVTVAYRLELNEFTAFRDMQPFSEEVPPGWQKSDPKKFYDGYARCYAGRLGSYLIATGDGKRLTFALEKQSHTLKENGKRLGHVRFDFV